MKYKRNKNIRKVSALLCAMFLLQPFGQIPNVFTTTAYAAHDPNCPKCGGMGYYWCPGEKIHDGHKVGNNTYQHPDGRWSCGYCDGVGTKDDDYEKYHCEDCGYSGTESIAQTCGTCGQVINIATNMNHIRFCDCTDAVPTNTPIPVEENTPVPMVVATVTPVGTLDEPVMEEPPTPVPPTSTPKPNATPTPIPQPQTYNLNRKFEYHKYYSSTNGHSVASIAENKKMASNNGLDAISLASALASVGKRTAYDVGVDASGNTWYVIKSTQKSNFSTSLGEVYTCTSVHPKNYKGYNIDSTGIRYINELTFPEYVTISGEKYYVRSIGGSGAYYYGAPTSPPSGTVSSNIGKTMGSYSWKSAPASWSFTYNMGVIGNGTITSDGYGITTEQYYDTYIYNNTYKLNYYIYNTTLASITIPIYCETVEDYAFHNCQSLLIINNGNNLKTIGTHAFSVSETPELMRSYHKYYDEYRYTYDDSYTSSYTKKFPSTMIKFQQYVTIGTYMEFPALQNLVTIGESAFENRSHLQKVVLLPNVKTVQPNAFKNCLLESIAVSSVNTVVKGNYDTLGTKGAGLAKKTMIVAPEDSPATQYGNIYAEYYDLMADIYVTYYPNGGSPNTLQKELLAVEYVKPDLDWNNVLLYDNEVQSEKWEPNSWGGMISNPDYCNEFYALLWLDTDGRLYYTMTDTDTSNVISGEPVPGLTEYSFVSVKKIGSFYGRKYVNNNDNIHVYYGITTNGEVIVFTLPTSTFDVKATNNIWIAPLAPTVSYTDVMFSYYDGRNSSTIISYIIGGVIGTDGKNYWYYDGRWNNTLPTNYQIGGKVSVSEPEASSVITLASVEFTKDLQQSYDSSSQTGTIEQAYITQDKTSKKLELKTVYTNISENNGEQYVSTSEKKYAIGTGEYVALQIDGFNNFCVYFLNEAGYLYRTYQINGVNSNKLTTEQVSSTKFSKIIPLAFSELPLTYAWTLTEKYGYDPNIDTDETTVAACPVLCLAVIDENGTLWSGDLSYNKAQRRFIDSLSVYSGTADIKFTDYIERKEETVKKGKNQQEGSTIKEEYTNTHTVTQYLYFLSEAGDVYKAEHVIREGYYHYYGCGCGGCNYYEATYSWNDKTSIALSLSSMNYIKEVKSLQGYPFLVYSDNELGSLLNINAVFDVYGGVNLTHVVYDNLWYTKSGYELTYWNSLANNSGKTYRPGDTYSLRLYGSDWKSNVPAIEFYAQWGAIAKKTKYVHYDANGGYGNMPVTTIPAGSNSYTVSANGFSKTGHRFAGYYTENADGTGIKYYPGQIKTAIKTTTVLYAQWTPLTYTVKFAYDDFLVKPPYFFDSATVTYAQTIIMPGEPQNKELVVDYDINTNNTMSTAASANWVTKRPFSTEFTHSRAKFIGWDQYSYKNGQYSADYYRFKEFEEVNGLSSVQNDVIAMFPVWGGIDAYVILPYATCPGYNLRGWMNAKTYKDASESVEYIPENGGGMYLPKGNDTLYAWWEPLRYTISFDSSYNGAAVDTSGTKSTVMTFDTICPEITAPTLEHYIFVGYFDKPNGQGTQYYGKADIITGKASAYNGMLWQIYDSSVTTLYAYWTPKQYQITLNDRGATSTGHTEKVTMTLDKYGPDIVVPEKTGYTFHGYFTKIKGDGIKYYDENGNCVKPWTENDVDTLYAYWIQNPVEFPEEDEYKEPEMIPEEIVEGSISREDAKGLLYADDYNASTGALTDLQPYLTYDTPGSQGAIPGTELLSFRAKMGTWMLNYKFHRYTGNDMVNIIVTVPYRTQYEKNDEELVISAPQIKSYSFLVPKAWSYWTVEESGMYYPDKITITNDAFKEEKVEVKVEREGSNAVVPPEYSAISYGDKKAHIRWPEYDSSGMPVLYITLLEEEYIISSQVDTPPDVDAYLYIVCKNAAWKDDHKAEVRSDCFIFDGEIVLSDDWREQNGAVLEEAKLPMAAEDIEETSYLQTYKSGVELDELKPNGMYATTAVITYVGDDANVDAVLMKEVPLENVNSLNIHTPVACEGVAAEGIKEGVLTLKNALNVFTLRVDNTGTHRMSLGYGTREFTFALSGKSNIAAKDGSYLNQVQFPFDVYAEDYYFEAGTWLTISNLEKIFYVPVTQKNGTYPVHFRTIAVNCPKQEDGNYKENDISQESVNINSLNYVATDSLEVAIRSYLRDFMITDTDDPTAQQQLLGGRQALVLKKGYNFSYELLTQGEFYGQKTEWVFTPEFYWVSEDEKERQKVSLYYNTYACEKETRECYAWENVPILKNHDNYEVILQRFKGNGRIPEDVLCVPANMKEEFGFSLEEYTKMQTITGKEEFFKQNGYLVIQLKIKVKSEEGIWYEYNNWENTKLYKDAMEAGWNYVPGDIIRYDLSKSIADDYEVGGVE